MATINSTVTINKPIEVVWKFFVEPANNLKWRSDLKDIKQVSPGLAGVGTKFTEVSEIFGQKVETPNEITEFEPNRKFGIKSTGGPIPFAGTFSFEPAGNGTQISAHFEFTPGGFFKLAEGMVVSQAQKQFEGDFVKLKQIVEAL